MNINNLSRSEAIRKVKHVNGLAKWHECERLTALKHGYYSQADHHSKQVEKCENLSAKIKYRYFL